MAVFGPDPWLCPPASRGSSACFGFITAVHETRMIWLQIARVIWPVPPL